jgi:Rad3-related DNA helicase
VVQFCPYFLSRDAAAKADLILLPYNYLIDPHIRSTLSTNLQLHNSVLVFDEAHNLEGVCGDSASFDLSAVTLAQAISEIQRCVVQLLDPLRTGADAGLLALSDGAGGAAGAGGAEAEELAKLKLILLELEQVSVQPFVVLVYCALMKRGCVVLCWNGRVSSGAGESASEGR